MTRSSTVLSLPLSTGSMLNGIRLSAVMLIVIDAKCKEYLLKGKDKYNVLTVDAKCKE